MPALAVTTEIFAPPGDVFAFLRDFPGYAKYSQHLHDVRQYGEGGVGTEYELDVAWWRLEYTARTEVTDIVQDERIEWRVVDGVDANGAWIVTAGGEADAPTEVMLYISYRTDGAASLPIDLPWFVSVESIIERVKPVVKREATATVERVVADLEGEPREADLEVDTDPSPPDPLQ